MKKNLWKTEHCPLLETPSELENRFRKSMSTQTDDFPVNKAPWAPSGFKVTLRYTSATPFTSKAKCLR
ncbi:hypothetical protein OUZ56_012386 [Daphnia magna]|uniref:Uncharacterized protein n=1 Tax=Daphnia magna TaxID=35525 RepID=A0ABQ9Z301_9CRUS|nr:hypothetical protein OUZ56_012386 [Daphnia magna]